MKHYISNSTFFTPRRILISLAVVCMSVFIQIFAGDLTHLMTTVLLEKEHPAFDGTINPIKEVPDWVQLTETERNGLYSEIPRSKIIEIPTYDNGDLTFPAENLVWGNSEHDRIRNVQITYSVPYLGSYELDGYEYSGSHPAVDIKAPKGTPVYAISNGVVVTVKNQSSGFGNHVVILHKNVPTLDDANRTNRIYSSYSHMDSTNVIEGDVVLKGQAIGTVGDTGFATTDHLHFQIDTDSAPWHPYWPFTSAEASAAGLSFVEAINAAFMQERAIDTTINPMRYVMQHLNESVLVATALAVSEPETTSEPTVITETVTDTELVASDNGSAPIVEQLQLKFKPDVLPLQGRTLNAFTLSLVDSTGAIVASTLPGSAITLGTSQGSALFDIQVIQPTSFINGQTRFHAAPGAGTDTLQLSAIVGDQAYLSQVYDVAVSEPEAVADVVDDAAVTVDSGNDTPDSAPKIVFSDLHELHNNYAAIADLVDKGFLAGYDDGTFRPENTVNRAEVVKFLYAAVASDLSLDEFTSVVLAFPDVPGDAWYTPYLKWGYNDEVIKGNPDGTYRGGNPVNAAEFFKMLFLALELDVDPEVDTELPRGFVTDAWYSSYIAAAIELGVLVIDEAGSTNLGPDHQMTRGEVAEVIYRVLQISDRGLTRWE